MSRATLPFPPQSTTRRPFRLSPVLAARAAFHIVILLSPPTILPLLQIPHASHDPGWLTLYTTPIVNLVYSLRRSNTLLLVVCWRFLPAS